jgi:two-component system, oxyanion-binding sensor
VLLRTLPGPAPGQPTPDIIADRSIFFTNAANYPWQSHARWYLRQMERWGYVERNANTETAIGIFRPDLYAEAAQSLGLSVPTTSVKTEGTHTGPWLLPAAPTSIEMRSDLVIDGAVFDGTA